MAEDARQDRDLVTAELLTEAAMQYFDERIAWRHVDDPSRNQSCAAALSLVAVADHPRSYSAAATSTWKPCPAA